MDTVADLIDFIIKIDERIHLVSEQQHELSLKMEKILEDYSLAIKRVTALEEITKSYSNDGKAESIED